MLGPAAQVAPPVGPLVLLPCDLWMFPACLHTCWVATDLFQNAHKGDVP